jgi:hypothetical protein
VPSSPVSSTTTRHLIQLSSSAETKRPHSTPRFETVSANDMEQERALWPICSTRFCEAKTFTPIATRSGRGVEIAALIKWCVRSEHGCYQLRMSIANDATGRRLGRAVCATTIDWGWRLPRSWRPSLILRSGSASPRYAQHSGPRRHQDHRMAPIARTDLRPQRLPTKGFKEGLLLSSLSQQQTVHFQPVCAHGRRSRAARYHPVAVVHLG